MIIKKQIVKAELLIEIQQFVTQLIKSKVNYPILFHQLDHTIDVVKAVRVIARAEKLSAKEIELLEIAAWFHDTGYSISNQDHEENSQVIAQSFLKNKNYPEEDINIILNCIAATKLPQTPQNHLEEVICDADLYHLSQPDYWCKNELLRKELEQCFKVNYDCNQWYNKNLHFLRDHKYFTNYGKRVLEDLKYSHLKKNLEMIKNTCTLDNI